VKVNRFFDGVYWINLPDARGRRTKMESFFHRRGIEAHRVEAVHGDILRCLMPPEWHTNIRFFAGCLVSHLQAMIIARAEGRKRILILEDDVLPLMDFDAAFDAFASAPVARSSEWDMIYLGFIPVSDDDRFWDYRLVMGDIVEGSPGFLHANRSFTGAYAYALSEGMRDFLLEALSIQTEHIFGVEAWLRDKARFHGKDWYTEKKIYGYVPQLFAHDNGVSSTTGQVEDRITRSISGGRREDYEPSILRETVP
jgi:GR25 family glycosyltransferase involved in LPS biosynthesis